MMYSVQTEKFQGPLDVLLNLIEEKKMSVNEIALAEVSDQYFSYVKNFADFPKLEVADFLVVAATLMLIKSKSLLPGFRLEEKEEKDIKELEMRIHMLKIFRKLARGLGEFAALGRSAYFRKNSAGLGRGFYPPKSAKISVFSGIARAIIEKIPEIEELPERMIERIVTIEEKMTELVNRIAQRSAHSLGAFISSGTREELIVAFLAVLELLKQGIIAVKQESDFGEIIIQQSRRGA